MSIRSGRRLGLLLVVALGITPLARAMTWDPAEFMPADELRRGMKGHILTIIEESRIERFPIEILSVEKNAFVRGDMIWAKGSGPVLAHTGVVGGMSGSPAYVDGRLIGAFAYGYSYAKDPLIGITPIEQMLAVWDRDMTAAPRARRPDARKMGFDPFAVPSQWIANRRVEDAAGARVPDAVIRHDPSLDRMRGATLERLRLPVAVRGVARGASDALHALFSEAGMAPFASVGGGGRVDVDAPVTPGSTIGTEYLRGDVSSFGFGTLTYRDGAKVLAYGHPALGEGDSYLPLSAGFVHFIVASQVRSFKSASPTRVVGTMTQDRQSAIAGIISDDHPPYLPVTVTVTTADGNAEEYNYEALRHPRLTGGLVRSAVWSTLDSAEKAGGDYTVRTKATVTFDAGYGHEPLVKTNVMSGTFAPGFAASTALSSVSSILNNWYDEIPIERIDLDVEFGDARQAAAIISARITKQRVRPGDSVDVAVTFRPYLDEPVVKSYSVAIPPDAPEGFTMAFVGDENSYLSWERTRATKKYQPSNAEQLLELLAQGGGGDRLMISLVSSKIGVAVAGEELPSLPLSMLNVMNASAQDGESNLTRGSVIAETTFAAPFDRPYVLSGGTLLSFVIDRDAR
jgi:hypothetical protein